MHWQLLQLILLLIGADSLILVILPNVIEMIVYKVLEMLGKWSLVVEFHQHIHKFLEGFSVVEFFAELLRLFN